MPSYGRAIGALFRESKALRTIPLVFLEGDPAKTGLFKQMLPDAGIALWERLDPALRRPIAHRPIEPAPVIPPDTPLHKKLRIRPNTEVAFTT